MGADSVAEFEAIVLAFSGAFTRPTVRVFLAVVRGWVQCLGRPAIRRLVSVVDGAALLVWACARFFRRSRWGMQELWRILLIEVLVPWFAATGRLIFAADDTTCEKFGKRVAFSAIFRDAVRSEGGQTVFHRAHCWVVLTLQLRLPLWKKVISFPVSARLYRKKADCDKKHPFRTRQQLVLEMIREVQTGLPDREIELVADGAYPCEELVTRRPRNVHFSSRMRSDAALYELAHPPRKPRRGRPRQKGERLPTPERMARRAKTWRRVRVILYGEDRERLVWTKKLLWWKVAKAVPVLLVISRDPDRKEDDDFFFTTDVEADPAHVVETFAMRWGIEEVFREGKQLVGFGKVQGWSARSVERQAPFALFVLSLVKAWYVHSVALRRRLDELPPTAAMLTELRFAYWQQRINQLSLPKQERAQILEAVRNALSAAA